MLKDLSKAEWISILGIPEDIIPEVLILRGTRNLRKQYERHMDFFSDVFEVNSPNDVTEDVFIGNIEGVNIGYASVYGAPMASEVVHIFGVLGTSLVIQTGCCGALSKELITGDLVYATSAYRGEGVSQYYYRGSSVIDASSNLLEIIKKESLNQEVKVYSGPVFTTSALFAEGRKELEKWCKKGYIAVDMETAATFAVAEYFKMKRFSILFVFDKPEEGSHILSEESKENELRKLGESEMIRLALKMALKHINN
ncbi:MAG: hypothetical protein U9O59_00090 [Actinomycetota bacterium]|nr:hypothetical protein [Actinomycetota bacterium]